jgi:hypothetical protein
VTAAGLFNGPFLLANLADAAAPNGTLYYSTDGDCAAHKTPAGDIRYLSYTSP